MFKKLVISVLACDIAFALSFMIFDGNGDGIAWLTKTETEIVEEEAETKAEVKVYYDVPLDHDIQDYLFSVCAEYKISPGLIISMIWRESDFDCTVIGDSGNAYGLMQIQPRWHEERMERLGVTDLLDAKQNILIGVDYLSELISWLENEKDALTFYRWGTIYGNRSYVVDIYKYMEGLQYVSD